ncbi:MAG: HD domain-containing protein [Ardenticatenaceae bacterium]|nr:HD domain-containing protein [Ardenticatenaceae bacterium]
MQPVLHANPDGHTFFEHLATYLPLEERKNVKQAFDLARREHGDDRRKSGELFFTHPLTVASYLAEYFVDAPALIAALLHDVAEDTSVSIQEITEQFGLDVGRIVDGLTKFDRVTAKAKLGRELSATEVKSATIYKLFEMMSIDVRVGIVKIFDRLHNMRTIGVMPQHKQAEKARETLLVYAPLANRLGMWRVKNELQEISLKILEPERFRQLKEGIERRDRRHESEFPNLAQNIAKVLTDAGLPVVEVIKAPEDLSSSFEQLKHREDGEALVFEAPPRILVLLKDATSCYIALGHVHARWRPVQGEFDDYIAAPKDNLYRSLHTTVIYNGRPIKIRFRTLNMQIESQAGILSKWLDNNNMPVWSKEMSERVDKVINTIGENIRTEEIDEGVKQVLDDVFTNQIIIYTPDGDMRELAQGATPIDFAYTIHTAVGHSCRGALVNGVKKSLTYRLQDGDSVRILRHGTEPQRAWLDEDLGYLNTRTAKAQVRRWFRRLPAEKSIIEGRQLLNEELALLNETGYEHEQVAKWFGYASPSSLYFALGRAELLPTDVAIKVLTESWTEHPSRALGQAVKNSDGEWFVVQNAGNRPLRLCGTCNPRPGDAIVGFIRKDSYVTVHSTICRTLTADAMRGGRGLKLRWGESRREVRRTVTIQINVHDRDGLLADVTDVLRLENSNITQICSRTLNYRATIILGIEASSPRQVVRVLHRIQALVNVISVRYFGQIQERWATDSETPSVICPAELLQDGLCSLHDTISPK